MFRRGSLWRARLGKLPDADLGGFCGLGGSNRDGEMVSGCIDQGFNQLRIFLNYGFRHRNELSYRIGTFPKHILNMVIARIHGES